jgi:GTPase SAR1 family protein
VEIVNTTIKMQIWDIARQERFHTLPPLQYHGAMVALLVYSIASGAPLDGLPAWAAGIKCQIE